MGETRKLFSSYGIIYKVSQSFVSCRLWKGQQFYYPLISSLSFFIQKIIGYAKCQFDGCSLSLHGCKKKFAFHVGFSGAGLYPSGCFHCTPPLSFSRGVPLHQNDSLAASTMTISSIGKNLKYSEFLSVTKLRFFITCRDQDDLHCSFKEIWK